jgi:hypothetical protein
MQYQSTCTANSPFIFSVGKLISIEISRKPLTDELTGARLQKLSTKSKKPETKERSMGVQLYSES